MQETTLITSIVTLLIVAYSIFFKSYFAEKGKNFATKEDIGGITNIVENIKSDLQYLTQSKFNIKTEERNALINFYEKYYTWLVNCIETYFSNISFDNLSHLYEIERKNELSRIDSINAFARATLFFDSKEITAKYHELTLKTLEIHNLNTEFGVKLSGHFMIKNIEEKTIDLINKRDFIRDKINIELEMLKDHSKRRIELYKPIAALNVEMQNLIYKHIQSHLSS